MSLLARPRPARLVVPRVQAALAGLACAAMVELALRASEPAGSHILGQNLAEAHAGLASLWLVLALVARPVRPLWAWPLAARRALGVLAFLEAVAHVVYAFQHELGGTLDVWAFLAPDTQAALGLGAASLFLLALLAATSTDWAVSGRGKRWKQLHRLVAPAFALAVAHIVWMGVHFGLGFGLLGVAPLASIALAALWLGVSIFRR
ncbi:MAG TPA: ferric reductase-like transmembrane domain-containing protein [Deinococcales bacterium]|nr:ferric reductase-like transmembrane domain-containing protein [Deinococcales bacterium]